MTNCADIIMPKIGHFRLVNESLGIYLFAEDPLIVYEVLYVTDNSVTHNSDSKASDSLIDS